MNKGTVAIILALMTPGDAMAEPKILADWQLDSITAAGVLVDVSSIAAALGDFARANTDANTFAFGGKHLDLGVGITMGQAIACCGKDADVEVGSVVLGIGDIVHGVTHTVKHDSSALAQGFSMGFVLAISFEEHFAKVRGQQLKVPDEHLLRFEELRTALTAFDIELPDGVRGSHLSSYRWSQMVGAQHPW